MTYFVYCHEDSVRALVFSPRLPLQNSEHVQVRWFEDGEAPRTANPDDLIVWWAPHRTQTDFAALLQPNLGENRPKILVFAPPSEIIGYLNTYARAWPDKLGNLKIFSSEAKELDGAAVAAMSGNLVPTGKWIQSAACREVHLAGPTRWLCNYSADSDHERGTAATNLTLNPYDALHVARYLLGNAMLGPEFRLLLYAHKTQYSPLWIDSDLDWWPDSVILNLWLVLYTGGDSDEISEIAFPVISRMRRRLPGRFARHSGFIQANVLRDHIAKFDAKLNFDPELPEPMTLVAISILCQGYLAAESRADNLLSKQAMNEIFGDSWVSGLPGAIQEEFGIARPELVTALICDIASGKTIKRDQVMGVLKELTSQLSR